MLGLVIPISLFQVRPLTLLTYKTVPLISIDQ